MGLDYLDFDLAIDSSASGVHVARVLTSPAGQASTEFTWPFTSQDLEIFILRIGHTRRGTRRIGSPETDFVRDFGRTLYDTVFTGQVGTCLMRSLDAVEGVGKGLRLRIHLSGSPELADVPWEYLYADELRRFIVVSAETPIVRYLDLPRGARPMRVRPPLRVLAVVSDPSDVPALNVEGEWERLQQSLGGLIERNALQLERLPKPTLPELQNALRHGDVHVLHYIGHGAFDATSGESGLYFEDDHGRAREVTGEHLGTVLHDHRALRLVVLNACEGARSTTSDPFSGTASGLVIQGLPAVIAMQFEISDDASLLFSQQFYAAIADGFPVDGALAEARKTLYTAGNDIEWGTPVLHMRSPDGHLFDIESSPEIREQPARVPAKKVAPPTPSVSVRAQSVPKEPSASGNPRVLRLLAAALAAVVIVVIAIVLFGGDQPVNSFELPNVEGQLYEDAAGEMQRLGLSYTNVLLSEDESGGRPQGVVAWTNPPAGTEVRRGQHVELFVSSGAEMPRESDG